jgi:hypothetical protein
LEFMSLLPPPLGLKVYKGICDTRQKDVSPTPPFHVRYGPERSRGSPTERIDHWDVRLDAQYVQSCRENPQRAPTRASVPALPPSSAPEIPGKPDGSQGTELRSLPPDCKERMVPGPDRVAITMDPSRDRKDTGMADRRPPSRPRLDQVGSRRRLVYRGPFKVRNRRATWWWGAWAPFTRKRDQRPPPSRW